ncbi:hypothetical protein BY996DRAFT_6411686 [Phakopsora pachyrhizi]|nr:hypothetical protein BY996DRAFT_6411686 [Phakopsora pachyrhizi]
MAARFRKTDISKFTAGLVALFRSEMLKNLLLLVVGFHRVENTERKAEGTGIGLALVQDIVKLHHGRLEVESEVDQGSKFTVAFQLGNEHLPAELIEHVSETKLEIINDRVMNSNARRWMLGDIEPSQNTAMIESPSASEVSSSRGSWDSLTSFVAQESVLSTVGSSILIADDNSDMRRFLMSVLSRYFVVKEASNGLEAFRLAKVHQPDLVLTDVMMPGIDGFQLLKKLKEDSETAGISVILLSACAGSENRIEGLSQGADDYLVKPFEAKELVARINTHLQQCKLRQRLESAVVHRTELLQENEQKYRDLYHTFEAISMLSPVGIIKLDICGRITFSNNSFHSQCSLSTDNTIEDWIDQIFLEDKGRMKQRFDDMFRRRQPTKGEFRWKNGSWCLYELTPYYQEDDQFFGFLGSTTDVSDRKEAERKQLEAAEARARDAEESKRQQEAFIDMTSHEIRNPLHGIHQAADLVHSSLKLLQQSADDNDCIKGEELERFRLEIEEDIDAIESIQLCASHQSRIADDIINVSKLSMGLLTTVKTEFDLVDRVREVLSMYYIEAQQKGVDLELQTGHGVGSSEYICADPNRLAQVTINFLSNALRYASNSDGQRKVTVKVDIFTSCPEPQPDGRRIGNLRPLQAKPGNEMVFAQVAVQDTARGLSAEELAKLFARFAQANPTQDQYGGSGLGLYVSHRLIENHGGFIEVVSTKGPRKGVKSRIAMNLLEVLVGRGFARSIKQHEAPEMRPASTLLPAGSMPLSGALNRYPSPDGQKNHSFQKHLRRKTMSNSSLSSRKINSEASVQTSPPYDLTSSMSKAAHVLVVEDNLINVKVIKRQLTLKGYAVSVAMDGRKALDVLYADGSESSRLSLIDIVLMDIQMPVMSGLEAIAELRKAEKSGNIRKRYPVIAVTGNARKEQMEQCLESGFDSVRSNDNKCYY